MRYIFALRGLYVASERHVDGGSEHCGDDEDEDDLHDERVAGSVTVVGMTRLMYLVDDFHCGRISRCRGM